MERNYFFCSYTENNNELSIESALLRQKAKVLAISKAQVDSQVLETVAKPDRIVTIGSEQMADRAIAGFCPMVTQPTGEVHFSILV